MDSSIADNQITLSRVVWDEENGEYTPTDDDQIMSTEKTSSGSNSISSVVIEKYETILEIVVKDPIDTNQQIFGTPGNAFIFQDRIQADRKTRILFRHLFSFNRHNLIPCTPCGSFPYIIPFVIHNNADI